MLRKLTVTALALTLLGLSMMLFGVAVLLNPAANGACTATASGLTVGAVADSLKVRTGDGTTFTLNKAQLTQAATIITGGSQINGVTRDRVQIALMAALTESTLRMLANTSAYPQSADYPNDGDASDHDSLGLFQRRPPIRVGQREGPHVPGLSRSRRSSAGPRAELPVPVRPPEHPRPAVHGQESGRPVRRVQRVPRPRYRSYEPVAKTILDTLTKPAESNSGEPNAAHPETSRIVFPLPEGTDYAAPDGTPIYTVADRIVELAEYSESWGGHIVIDHTVDSHAISTGYIHMWASGIYVTVGQRVTARQHIGDVGSSGQSTGPHLYFEVRPGGGQAIDGDAWLTAHGAPVRAAKPTWSTRA